MINRLMEPETKYVFERDVQLIDTYLDIFNGDIQDLSSKVITEWNEEQLLEIAEKANAMANALENVKTSTEIFDYFENIDRMQHRLGSILKIVELKLEYSDIHTS